MCLGSEIVENAMDKIQDIIEDEMEGGGSWHYRSGTVQGYCDWQVSEQHKLFTFLP